MVEINRKGCPLNDGFCHTFKKFSVIEKGFFSINLVLFSRFWLGIIFVSSVLRTNDRMTESCGRCVLRHVLCCAYWYSHSTHLLSEVWVSPRRSLPTVLYDNDLTRSWTLSSSNIGSLPSPAFFNWFNFHSQKEDNSIWWNKNVEIWRHIFVD